MDAPYLDPEFKADLRRISPSLEIRWDRDLERWVIWYKNVDTGAIYRIHEVSNINGGYKHPDQLEIDLLRRCDMRGKVKDPKYIFSEQFRQRENYKKEQIQKQKEEALYRSRQLKSKWTKAIDNADRGIFHDWQVAQQTIYSIPKKTTVELFTKLGRPHLTGKATMLKPKPQTGRIIA